MLAAVGASLAGALAALPAGCDSAPATTTNGGGGGVDATYAASSCNACIDTACKAELEACGADPGCTAYLSCIDECPLDEKKNLDAACDAACGSGDSTEAKKLIAAVRVCHQKGPGGACTECGSPKNDVLPPPAEEGCPPLDPSETLCHQCYFSQMCHTYDGCFDGTHPDCDDLGTCFAACETVHPGDDCVAACFDMHPTSVVPFTTLLAKETTVCHAGVKNCDVALEQPCEQCAFQTCGDSLYDLMTTEPGFLLYWCVIAECKDGSIPCIDACVQKYPAGNEDFFLWSECLANVCDAACQ